jgi:hypothetical protein
MYESGFFGYISTKTKFRNELKTVAWLRRLVADLSPHRSGFAPGFVRFVFDRVTLRQVKQEVSRLISCFSLILFETSPF